MSGRVPLEPVILGPVCPEPPAACPSRPRACHPEGRERVRRVSFCSGKSRARVCPSASDPGYSCLLCDPVFPKSLIFQFVYLFTGC